MASVHDDLQTPVSSDCDKQTDNAAAETKQAPDVQGRVNASFVNKITPSRPMGDGTCTQQMADTHAAHFLPSAPSSLMPRQLSLGLSYRKAYNLDDFMVAPCNVDAVTWLDLYPNWPAHAMVILGPSGSGKTHLAHIFSKNVIDGADLTDTNFPEHIDKIVVENIDRLANEAALFHLYNWTKEQGIGLLMTAVQMPDIKLPDLKSRLYLAPKIQILPPDDDLIYAVLMKAFFERNILVDPSVLEYAVKQIERSFPAVHRLIDTVDKVSLEKGRRITIPIVKEALRQV